MTTGSTKSTGNGKISRVSLQTEILRILIRPFTHNSSSISTVNIVGSFYETLLKQLLNVARDNKVAFCVSLLLNVYFFARQLDKFSSEILGKKPSVRARMRTASERGTI